MDDRLNREAFKNGKEAQAIVEAFKQEYTNYRPHSSLNYLTPVEFVRRYYEKNQVKEVSQSKEVINGRQASRNLLTIDLTQL